MARPTVYEPEMCERVIEMGKAGKSKAGMAAGLDIATSTLYKWCDENDEFSEAVELALTYSQGLWEDVGFDNLKSNFFQAAVYNKQMGNRFRKDHGDVKEVVQRQSGVISSEPLSAEEWEKLYSDDKESE